MVVAQLAKRSLPTPERSAVRSPNWQSFIEHYLLSAIKDENEEKEAENCPLFKSKSVFFKLTEIYNLSSR